MAVTLLATYFIVVMQSSRYSVFHNGDTPIRLSCYDSMLKVLSKELTLVLSDTRELDKVPSIK